MGLMARDKGGADLTPIPEDLHLAVCYGIWDIGTQYSERFGRASRKVIIVWEIPGVRAEFEYEGQYSDGYRNNMGFGG